MLLLFNHHSSASDYSIRDTVKDSVHTLTLTRNEGVDVDEDSGIASLYLAEVYAMKVCQGLGKNFVNMGGGSKIGKIEKTEYQCLNGKKEDVEFQMENIRIICIGESSNEDIKDACAEIDSKK